MKTIVELIYFLAAVSTAYSHFLPDGELFVPRPGSRTPQTHCEKDADCAIEGSTCKENKCECPLGYLVGGSLIRCVRVATGYLDECEDNLQCATFLSSGGVCIAGRCGCADGYHYFRGECIKSRALNEPCEKDDDCFVGSDIQAASCERKRCTCSSGYYKREYSSCRRYAKDDEDKDCILSSDCSPLGKNVTCVNQICVKAEESRSIGAHKKYASPSIDDEYPRYEDAEEIDAATRPILLGSSCTSDEECASIKHSKCGVDKTCICDRSFFSTSDKTGCTPEIGNSCETNEKLGVKYAECVNGKWACRIIRVGDKANRSCPKVARAIGANCNQPEVCSIFGPRALCENGKCICDSSSYWLESEKFCWIKRKIGERCSNDRDCLPKGDDESSYPVCTPNGDAESVCACPDGSRESLTGDYCVQDQTELNKSYCELDDDCGVPNSSCDDNKCQCSDSFFEEDGQCLRGLKSDCEKDDDCKLENSHCSNSEESESTCQCKENFVALDKKCIGKSGFEEKCEHDIQCDSVVKNSRCYVDEKSSSSRDAEKTREGSCRCMEGYFYNYGDCYEIRELGEECTKQGQCFVVNSTSICLNGICSCDFGYKADGRQCKVNNAPAIKVQSSCLILSVLTLFLLTALQA